MSLLWTLHQEPSEGAGDPVLHCGLSPVIKTYSLKEVNQTSLLCFTFSCSRLSISQKEGQIPLCLAGLSVPPHTVPWSCALSLLTPCTMAGPLHLTSPPPETPSPLTFSFSLFLTGDSAQCLLREALLGPIHCSSGHRILR